jgi:hypothetical protein
MPAIFTRKQLDCIATAMRLSRPFVIDSAKDKAENELAWRWARDTYTNACEQLALAFATSDEEHQLFLSICRVSAQDTAAVQPLPRVNLNGTSRNALIQQRREVCDALNSALEALERAAPHGRDYQTAPDGALETARHQHEARCTQLAELRRQITQEAIEIKKQ